MLLLSKDLNVSLQGSIMSVYPRPVRFQNTYRLESKNPFNRDEVEKILAQCMERHFSSLERFDATSVALCRNVSDDALGLIKAQNFDRYKIIVVVTVCEKFMQGISYANKNLWDAQKDSIVTHVYDHTNFFAIGICYGIYYE